MDPGSFAIGGWSIFKEGWFTPETVWVISFWPPGFMCLQAIILKIFGGNAPLVGIIQILSSFLLAVVSLLFRQCLLVFLKARYATIIPLFFLLSAQFRYFILGQDGVLLGEAFSVSFVLIGLFLLLLAAGKNFKVYAFIAGLFFALSAYFRSPFELFFLVGTFNFLPIVFLMKLLKKTSFSALLMQFKPVKIIFVALLSFHFFTVPYRIYNYYRVHSFSWVQTSNAILEKGFYPSEPLLKTGGGFFVLGGGNIACSVDQKKCEELGPQVVADKIPHNLLIKESLKTFISHPLLWIYLKLKLLPTYWFSTVDSFVSFVFSSSPSLSFSFENLMFAFSFVAGIFCLIYQLIKEDAFVLFWLSSSILLGYSAIITFAHFEVRYFFFCKFYFLTVFLLFLSRILKDWFSLNQGSLSNKTKSVCSDSEIRDSTLN